jgi:hypothetical protein
MNATSKFHDSMCFGHVCKDMASELWGHLDSKISSSSWNEKRQLQFLKSRIFVASRWSLLVRAHKLLQIRMQIHMCQYKHRERPLSFKNLNWLKLFLLTLHKQSKIWANCNHKSPPPDLFFALWMAKVPSVDNVHLFPWLFYFALFYIISHNGPIT